MNNEETRILNPQQQAEVNNNTEHSASVHQTEEKPTDQKNSKLSNKKGAAFAAAAGGAVGAAAATSAQHLYNQMQEETEEVEVEEVEAVEPAPTPAPTPTPAPAPTPAAEPVVAVEPKVADDPIDVIPEDAKLDGSEDATSTSTDNNVITTGGSDTTPQESDVHVLGVDLIDDGEGGQMFVAALEDSVSGDQALVVDVDLDGTIDVLAVDENHNQQIEADEIYDVSDQGWQSQGYVEAYAQEQQMLHEEQNYIASDDSTDYMNDADTGYFEA